jgi:N-acetylneuraminic acid mutarotase
MKVARSHFASAVFQGKIYLFGGGGEGFQSLNRVEIYDPVSDRWSDGREMPTVRSGVVAVSLNDRIYVMGGGFKQPDGSFRFLTTVEIYRPAEDSWENGPDLLMRHDAPAAAVLNEEIYVIGGHHPEAKGGPLTDPAFSYSEKLNPSSERWVEIPPMPTPRFSPAALSWQARLLVLGGGAFTGKGFTNYDRVEGYDPSRQSWSEERALKLPWPTAGPGACLLNRRIFVFGGNNGEAIQSRGSYYDPAEGRWLDLPPMPEARVVMAALPLGDTIYIVGGRDATGKAPTNTVFALNLG